MTDYRFEEGDYVRIDIPHKRDPDHDRLPIPSMEEP